MAIVAIPSMTKPWKVVAAAMAVFGFVYGYVGTAGGPFCGSMGGCLELAVDRGLAGFAPASLIPGAIAALIFAALIYLLFLAVQRLRNVLHWLPAARMSQEPPAARLTQAPSDAERHTEPMPVQAGPSRWSRPTPLVIAIGAALTWAILSVGPGNIAADAAELFPTDIVTSPDTYCNTSSGYVRPNPTWIVEVWVLEGSKCTIYPSAKQASLGVPATSVGTVQACKPPSLPGPRPVPEADGMCHTRKDGYAGALADDLVDATTSGLLAFLVVGAALLLWPRLRVASQPTI